MSDLKREEERLLWFEDQALFLIDVLKAIGDGVAFTYLDKYDIKPLAFKEDAGFLSGKAGLALERRVLRYAHKHRMIAILNDLTSCLRFGDLTLLTPNGAVFMELKSGRAGSPRARRQAAAIKKMTEYLSEDVTENLYDLEGTFRRSAPPSPERNHVDALNRLIATARLEGSATGLMEDGLSYAVYAGTVDRFPPPAGIEQFKSPVGFLLNAHKFANLGHYPFTLSLHEPETVYGFYAGEFVVAITLDLQALTARYERRGFSVKIDIGEERPITVSRPDLEAEGVRSFSVGSHMFRRIFIEFVELDWFVEMSTTLPLGQARAIAGSTGASPDEVASLASE